MALSSYFNTSTYSKMWATAPRKRTPFPQFQIPLDTALQRTGVVPAPDPGTSSAHAACTCYHNMYLHLQMRAAAQLYPVTQRTTDCRLCQVHTATAPAHQDSGHPPLADARFFPLNQLTDQWFFDVSPRQAAPCWHLTHVAQLNPKSRPSRTALTPAARS